MSEVNRITKSLYSLIVQFIFKGCAIIMTGFKEEMMESVFYKCPTCGFTHQVPAYWSGFAPEKEMEMPHMNLETKEMCVDTVMKLIEEDV